MQRTRSGGLRPPARATDGRRQPFREHQCLPTSSRGIPNDGLGLILTLGSSKSVSQATRTTVGVRETRSKFLQEVGSFSFDSALNPRALSARVLHFPLPNLARTGMKTRPQAEAKLSIATFASTTSLTMFWSLGRSFNSRRIPRFVGVCKPPALASLRPLLRHSKCCGNRGPRALRVPHLLQSLPLFPKVQNGKSL